MVDGRSPMPAPTSRIWWACSYTVTSAPSRLRALAAAAPPYPAPTTAIVRSLMSMVARPSVRDGQEGGGVVDEDRGDRGLVETGGTEVRDQVLDDVVDGVALHARPTQRAAVGVGRGQHLVQVAVDETQEVVQPLLARAGPERRVGQLGLIAEGVEADAPALLGDPGVAGLVGVDAVVDVPEEHPVQREPLLAEDGDGVLGVDGQMGQDRHTRGQG